MGHIRIEGTLRIGHNQRIAIVIGKALSAAHALPGVGILAQSMQQIQRAREGLWASLAIKMIVGNHHVDHGIHIQHARTKGHSDASHNAAPYFMAALEKPVRMYFWQKKNSTTTGITHTSAAAMIWLKFIISLPA